MRVGTLLGSAIVAGLIAHAAAAQTLAKVAEDERERRETNASESAPSFTNVGVREHRHRTGVTCYCYLTLRTPAPPELRVGPDPFWSKMMDDDRRRRTIWQNKRLQLQAAHRSQTRRLDELLVLERRCASGGVSVFWREPWGNESAMPSWGLGASLCEAVPEKIKETRRAIERTQAAAHNEARKLRIDPGYARLQ